MKLVFEGEPPSWVADCTDQALRARLGAGTWVRGAAYARDRAVQMVRSHAEGLLLQAEVRGSRASTYAVLVRAQPARAGGAVQWTGHCTWQRERQRVLGLLDDLQRNRFQIFKSLTLLRQLSLDASLVDERHAGVRSSKIDVLVEQLREVTAEGHRVLVFSQFTGFLGLVRTRLAAEGIGHCYLDGRTRNRPKRIAEFTDGDAPVFLISLKAGGVGLTLTEADYVFVLDPWWNPATEAQAVDRAHRIGQDKTVMVYRMVAAGTIEEKVVALQQRKRDLFTRVVDDDAMTGGALTAEDIRGLFLPERAPHRPLLPHCYPSSLSVVKLSVSLAEEDLAALDAYVQASGLRSRSAALQHAIRLLRHRGLEQDYATAWEDWESSGQRAAWEGTVRDGLPDAAR